MMASRVSGRPPCSARLHALEALVDRDVRVIREEINSTFGRGPDLYFYKKTVSRTKNASSKDVIRDLLDKKFVELLYATLTSWGMHSRGARMKPFKEFYQSIEGNAELFAGLVDYNLESVFGSENTKEDVVKSVLKLFVALDVMEPRKRDGKEAKSDKVASKLVANSKLMHFVLPHLVMPIDRVHTVSFFKGCEGASHSRPKPEELDEWGKLDSNTRSEVRVFLKIHNAVADWLEDKKILKELEKLLDNEWNQTVPKVVDNLILLYCKGHKDKNGECKPPSSP